MFQRLTDKRECLAKSRAPLKGPEYPQADVVSVPISCQATARMAGPRVSDRVQTEKIHISVFPPVYNDIKREVGYTLTYTHTHPHTHSQHTHTHRHTLAHTH